MLTTKKVALHEADVSTKQEPLGDFIATKTENSDSYREVSLTIDKTPFDIKVEPEETETKLALVDTIEKEADSLQGLRADDIRSGHDLCDERTRRNQGLNCNVCSKTVSPQWNCIHHIQRQRQMSADRHSAKPLSKPNAMPDRIDVEPGFYCEPCDAKFTKASFYQSHVRKPHTTPVILLRTHKPKSKREPNIDDPNAYCNVCKCIFRTRSVYRAHLHGVHQIGASRGCEVPLTFKCPICKRRYKSKRSCDDHVKTKHNTISLL